MGRIADLMDIIGYLFEAPNQEQMMAQLDMAMAAMQAAGARRKLLGSQDNFALLNTDVDELAVTALLALPTGAVYRTRTSSFNVDASWLSAQDAYDGSMVLGHYEFPAAL